MQTEQLVAGGFTGLLSLLLALYLSFTLRCKGPIFSNSYLRMAPEERKKANKKAEYRQVSIVFGALFGVFTCLTIHIFTRAQWSLVLSWVFIVLALAYALVKSFKTMLPPK